ncbi:MAG: uroporphyrinogen decarboxylase family protein [Candidatus Hinthialibacter antarcticus]|nr:uroporphyrinogen decarboxylase family protein [Candidatus Hinthialibacter antarcticus]
MNGRERVLAMIAGKKTDQLPLMPITMMFAVDQINKTYAEYASDHRVLVEAQIATAERFEFDYVSVISDPAREAADLGADVEYFDDQPPALNEQRALLQEKPRLNDLDFPDPHAEGRMNDRVKAVELFKQRVGGELLIEGWVEGPCAQASDLRGINALMMDFYDDPEFVNALFDFVIEMELIFAVAQIEAGADIIGVGDAAASLVGPKLYKQFVLPAQKRMIDGLHSLGAKVRLHICGKTRKLYEGMGSLECEIVDLDSMNPMDEARSVMGKKQVLLGNISPVDILKNGTPEIVTSAIAECHKQCAPRYIVGAGCEVPRGTPIENVEALTQYAQSHKP